MIRATLTAALVLALGGCFVPLSQGQAMENDLVILRDRLVAVEDRAETDDALLRERVAQAQRDAERIRETMAKVDKIARRADANSAKSWSLCARGWRRSRGGSRRWSTRLARARQRTQSSRRCGPRRAA